ncbi:hypothetical protein O988_02284 [Pseudogymnoascus sp. VKM F-3808]|nr:hypothetical protein O988_02284 [Pseudogymnoascus sp. VKM F-3808]
MKIFLLLSVVAFVRLATCNGPSLGFHPETAKDCIDWIDNGYEETCEEVLDFWNITPELFHKWNPAVGLDCKPWEYLSYCVFTKERYDELKAKETTTSPISTTATPTTSARTLGPSPTHWEALGCYHQDGQLVILEEMLSPKGGDSALSISKCKNACFSHFYDYTGVRDGNQCWCSSYVAGKWTDNQTDCNVPCSGDDTAFCGGKGVYNVFAAEENLESSSTSTTVLSATPSSGASTTVLSATPSSGAIRNIAIF